MTPEEAIKIQGIALTEKEHDLFPSLPKGDYLKAVQLGIEALERLGQLRDLDGYMSKRWAQEVSELLDLLPSEGYSEK